MENKKNNLNNISKRLNEITDYLVDLKKETARVVIKQIYYNCFLNKLKLEDIFEILSEMREETNLRLQIELDKIIAKTSINNVLEILNEEINTAINVDIALIMYLITNEDIQAILEDDIPVLLNFTKILYNMNTKFVDFPIERVANILLNLIDEINLEEMNFDELFEMMNDTLKNILKQKKIYKNLQKYQNKQITHL